MCRLASIRRCPSHSDPVAIAARNARRRAAYAAKKAALKAASVSETNVAPTSGNVSVPDNTPAPKMKNIYSAVKFDFDEYDDGRLAGLEGKARVRLYKKVDTDESLNITYQKQSGNLVNAGYLAPRYVRGVINYNNLDEESYSIFGFQNPHENPDGYQPIELPVHTVCDLSAVELDALNVSELLAARFFTSTNYDWFNSILYGKNTKLPKPDKSYKKFAEEGYGIFDEDNQEDAYASNFSIPPEYRTEETVQKICSVLDDALSRGPKRQRILYRGKPGFSSIFNKAGGVSNWVDQNMPLGKEVVFDGYQSASQSFDVACEYSGSSGLIYEILTPEGINVTNVSKYENEREVVLPRQARYVVVGVHKNVKCPGDYEGMTTIVQLVAINEKGEILDGTNASPKTDPFENRE
mgnify:CR=1 FL=1|jgi:hypothetical protein